MIFENVSVVHKVFGAGVITQKSGKYITVKFENVEKNFVYPDIFDGFLSLADGGADEDILRDIEESKKHKQMIMEKKKEENLRAMNHGIVIPGKALAPDGEDEESTFKDFDKEDTEI